MVKRSVYFIAIFFICSCASKTTPGKVSGYSEDISLYRPVYPDVVEDSITLDTMELPEDFIFTPPNSSLTAGLDSLLDSIASYTRSRGYYTAYTIQVYTGSSSKEANDAKAEVYREFQNLIPKLEYQQPIFKVKVGLFYEKFDALKTLNDLKQKFPSAILIPERIYPDH